MVRHGRYGEIWGERVRAVRALHLVPVRHVVRLEPRGQLAVDRDDHLVRFRVRVRVRVRVRGRGRGRARARARARA